MKKILNEWKRFILKETNQPGINDELGASESGFPQWWGNFDDFTGTLQGKPSYKKWLASISQIEPGVKENLENEISSLQKQIKEQPTSDIRSLKRKLRKVSKEWKHRFGGYCYGVNRYYSREEAEKLIKLKISDYVSNAPEPEVEFLFANLDRFNELGDSTMVEHSEASTGVAFYGKPTDWWMFGDGWAATKEALQNAKEQFLESKGPDYELRDAYSPNAPSEPTPDQVAIQQRGEERSQGMADMFSRFFADNPPEPKRRRRK
jgi:hypothetical protein